MWIKHFIWLQRSVVRYLKRSWLYTIFGLIGLSLVSAFSSSLDQKIIRDGKKLLTADIMMSVRGKWEEDIDHYLQPIQEQIQDWHENIEVVSMARTDKVSLLVNLVAIDKKFPYYNEELESDVQKAKQPGFSVLSKEASARLNLNLGDSFYVGDNEYQVAKILDKPHATFNFQAFLPSIYVAKQGVEGSALIGPLSSETRKLHLKLKEDVDIKVVSSVLSLATKNTSIRIRSFDENSSQSIRVVERMTQFMSLMALVCFIYAAIGCLYSFRQFLLESFSDILIHKVLGYSTAYILKIWNFVILEISILFFLIVAALQWICVLLVRDLSFFRDIDLEISWLSLVYTFLFSYLLHVLIYFIYRNNIRTSGAAKLLGGDFAAYDIRLSKTYLAVFVLFLLALAFLFTNSIMMTAIFMVTILLLLVAIWFFLQIFIYLLSMFKNLFTIKYVRLLLKRKQGTFLSISFSLVVGMTLVQVIPLVTSNIEKELLVENHPNLFLLDIQEDQLDPLKSFLNDSFAVSLNLPSPFIRARLISINDREVKDSSFLDIETQESRRKEYFRNRAFNLTYRKELSKDEKLLKGIDLNEYKGDYVPVSIEKRFSERTDIYIGDILAFDILGQKIKAEVANIRYVNWLSFQPNFFVQFGDGPLNDFPKTYIGTISNLNEEQKAQLQFNISERFSNISSVDLDSIIAGVLDLMYDFKSLLQYLSLFSLFVGGIVFIAIYQHFMKTRQEDFRIFYIMGLSQKDMSQMLFVELISQFCFSFLTSMLGAYFLSMYIVASIFNMNWTYSWKYSLYIGVSFLLFFLLTFVWEAKILRQKKFQKY
tara:strand:+ start:1794 stop:4259 length:2466 start_codon:yes stop_codon:yes gene_type:complete